MRLLNERLAVMWLPASLIMIGGPIWLAWGRWRTLIEGHPLTNVVATAVLIVGALGLVWAIGTLVMTQDTPARSTVGRRVAATFSIIVVVIGVVVSLALGWARPLPAQPVAVAAMRSSGPSDPGTGVRLVQHLTWYEFVPNRPVGISPRPAPAGSPTTQPSDQPQPGSEPPIGMIFSPGAKVDARAYAAMLRPFAEAGVLVVVLKEPFGLALLPDGQVGAVLADHPAVKIWVAAGHSMGGVEAARMVNDHPEFDALLLWAGYPGWPVSRPISVLSISGSADGLSTPAAIGAAKPYLPDSAQYLEVAGANHAAFGDYGRQPGDGALAGDRAAIQAKIIDASLAFVLGLH